MRQLAGADRIRRFMRELGRRASSDSRIYFTGGASAVLIGWRSSTIDVDLACVPDRDDILRLFPGLKDELEINIELASPADFLPELEGWEDRSPFIEQCGVVTFRHYDFYAQALAKVERGHALDVTDVEAMLRRGLVEPEGLRRHLASMEPRLYRFPAVDPAALRRSLENILAPR